MIKIKFLTLIFLLVGLFVQAQSTIMGTVFNNEQTPLAGALVYLEGTAYNTITDAEGQFKLFNIPSGEYSLIVQYIGYSDSKISINAESSFVQEIILSDDLLMQEVIINGRLEGQAKAMSMQRNNINITQIIASQQMERFPDANIGDALKRLSGINVQYDQGEARFANIRGTAPEMNSVSVNGERIPSAEAEKRYNQLDLIPSDMIELVELSKALTPDMDADAIGGSINLVTKKAGKKPMIKATLGSGYGFLSEKPLLKGKLSLSRRYANNKFGILLNTSYLNRSIRSDNIEAEWEFFDDNNPYETAYTSDFQIRQYELQRERMSYSAKMDYKFNANHLIYADANYTKRNDFENRYRLRYKDIEQDEDGNWIAEIRRQTKGGSSSTKNRRLEDQRTSVIGLGGEHSFNKARLTWRISDLRASEERPDERYVSFRAKDQGIIPDFTNKNAPSFIIKEEFPADLDLNYGLKDLSEENQFTDERDLNGRVDLEIPIFSGLYSSRLKMGGRYKSKSKKRSNSFYEFAPLDEDVFVQEAISAIENKSFDNFQAGDYPIGSFVQESYLGALNFDAAFESEEVLEELAGNFNASEDVTAAYLMYTQDIGRKIQVLAGLRYEGSQVEYAGQVFDGETLTASDQQSDQYANILPGVHIKYSPVRYANFRLAWTNTIARPNYFDLVPYQEINTEDNEIKIGNPSLEATTSMNVDLLGEFFFQNIGIVSAGLFGKNLTNVISSQVRNDFQFNGQVYDRFEQPVNVGNAIIYGAELAIERRLNFLPGKLSNLSLYSNYTLNISELTNISLEDREDESLSLIGTPQHLFNASLAYDAKKFDIRLSYNFADRFIEEYNDEAFYDRWYDQVQYLDLNLNADLSKRWKIYASVNNILNQPLRYYQGVTDQIMQIEYYGLEVRVGAKFKL